VVSSDWPRRGDVRFEDVSISYEAGVLEPAVRRVNVSVGHGQRLGVCGRTGSGKSTLAHALFRLADLTDGRVLLDGVDVAAVDAHYLRSRLSVVPQVSGNGNLRDGGTIGVDGLQLWWCAQDPLVMAGTLRDNLVAEDDVDVDDEHIWQVLRHVGLHDTLRPIGLGDSLFSLRFANRFD